MELLSKEVQNNELISKNLQEIIDELQKIQSKITEVKAPTEEGVKHQETLLKQIDDGRGRPLFYPYVGSGVGRGPYVELEDGSIKLDLINGIGVNILGHSHPRLAEAMMKAGMSDLVMQGNLQPNNEYNDMLQNWSSYPEIVALDSNAFSTTKKLILRPHNAAKNWIVHGGKSTLTLTEKTRM